MKFVTLLFVTVFGLAVASAEEFAMPWLPAGDRSLPQAEIGKIRVQAISEALVELKLQEIGLQQSGHSDREKLALIHAQQRALEQEIIRVTISTLEDDERRLSEKYLSEHPRIKAIRSEIELQKAELKRTS